MPITIATWNVNSVRLRIENFSRLLAELDPDVLCLQETKVQDIHFPQGAFEALGYRHCVFHGMKSYNGVAILSRLPLAKVGNQSWCGREDCRHLFATLPDGTEVHSLYVPAGGDIPDPEVNPRFAHKLDFLRALPEWFAAHRRHDQPMVVAGDFNVAPLETDVWSHSQLLKVVSHTPVEVDLLTRFQDAMAWVDGVRHFIPPAEKLYSWWSYRAADWTLNDRGRRLDHLWVSPALAPRLAAAKVLREARGWPLASDHVPVALTLE